MVRNYPSIDRREAARAHRYHLFQDNCARVERGDSTYYYISNTRKCTRLVQQLISKNIVSHIDELYQLKYHEQTLTTI